MNHPDLVLLCTCIIAPGGVVIVMLFLVVDQLLKIRCYLEWFKRFYEEHYGGLKKSIDPFQKH